MRLSSLNIISSRKVGLLVFILLTTLLVFYFALQSFERLMRDRAESRAQIFHTAIENELSRLKHLPPIIAQLDVLQSALVDGDYTEVNQTFLELSNSSESEAIYLLDKTGLTVAASNFQSKQTFLGENYGFRQYFKEAIEGQDATLFAIGATTSRPGYFLAAPVEEFGDVSSVAVVKLDLTALNTVLENSGEEVLVVRDDGIVVLSSNLARRYKTIRPIDEEARARLSTERQFGSEPIDVLNWDQSGQDLTFEGRQWLVSSLGLENENWRVVYLLPKAEATRQAIATTSIFSAVMILLALFAGFVRENRVRRALADSQKDRERLQDEIEVRRKTEERLERARKDLEQSNKMVALGQLSASVTHELGQPISAMRNHIAAQEIANDLPPKFLDRFSQLVTRMENITKQLRFFASKNEAKLKPISPSVMVENALGLLAFEIEENGIEVSLDDSTQDQKLTVDQDRVERVFVNIIQNSLKAMAETSKPKLSIIMAATENELRFTFSDNGHGLSGATIDTLSEPFHTTRASGDGMGLGLAISGAIVKEHAGRMEAYDNEDGGADFVVTFPIGEAL